MEGLTTTIPVALLDSLVPKEPFATAKKEDIIDQEFELKGMSNFQDPLIKDMSGITAEDIGGMALYYRGDKGYNTNIPIRALISLQIEEDGAEDDSVTTLADHMKETAKGTKGADPSFPAKFKVIDVVDRVNDEGKKIFRFDAYTKFQDKLEKLQKVQGDMTDEAMIEAGKLPARRQIFRDRRLISSLVGTEGLSDPTVEPLKDIKIEMIS